MRTLAELKDGERAKVIKINGRGIFNRRVRDMGLMPGVEVQIEGRAPLGDPLNVKIQRVSLTLRMSEAKHVYVEELK